MFCFGVFDVANTLYIIYDEQMDWCIVSIVALNGKNGKSLLFEAKRQSGRMILMIYIATFMMLNATELFTLNLLQVIFNQLWPQ